MIGIYLSTKKNYRRREEHGSAKWGNAKQVNKKYEQKPQNNNKTPSDYSSEGVFLL